MGRAVVPMKGRDPKGPKISNLVFCKKPRLLARNMDCGLVCAFVTSAEYQLALLAVVMPIAAASKMC